MCFHFVMLLQLSIDRRSAGVFKAFTTGDEARSQQTWGSFGVGNVTGRGHVRYSRDQIGCVLFVPLSPRLPYGKLGLSQPTTVLC